MVLENEFTHIGCFLNELILDQEAPSSSERGKLTADVLESVLASVDTEYDRNALKGILFTFLSRSEIYALGVKPDRALNFLSKTLQASEEVENAQVAAEDMILLKQTNNIKYVWQLTGFFFSFSNTFHFYCNLVDYLLTYLFTYLFFYFLLCINVVNLLSIKKKIYIYKKIGHWTKLFLIDILLCKNKTSQGTSIIFFLF